MSRHEFPYVAYGGYPHPIVPLVMRGKEEALLPIHALIDSGSHYCVFNPSLLEDLGRSLASGTQAEVELADGDKLSGFLHVITFSVPPLKKTIQCPCFFPADRKLEEPAIVGRIGFFEEFKITFLEREKKVVLDEY